MLFDALCPGKAQALRCLVPVNIFDHICMCVFNDTACIMDAEYGASGSCNEKPRFLKSNHTKGLSTRGNPKGWK